MLRLTVQTKLAMYEVNLKLYSDTKLTAAQFEAHRDMGYVSPRCMQLNTIYQVFWFNDYTVIKNYYTGVFILKKMNIKNEFCFYHPTMKDDYLTFSLNSCPDVWYCKKIV